MTATAETTLLPSDPRNLPYGPKSIEIEGLHLSISSSWESGATHNIHLLENGDLSLILDRGQSGHMGSNRVEIEDVVGHVIVSLGVDDDHDEVHFSHLGRINAEECISQALEALHVCQSALARIRRS